MNQVQSRARSSSPSSRKLKEATIDFLKCLALSLSTGTCPASRGKSRPARGSWRGHATPRAWGRTRSTSWCRPRPAEFLGRAGAQPLSGRSHTFAKARFSLPHSRRSSAIVLSIHLRQRGRRSSLQGSPPLNAPYGALAVASRAGITAAAPLHTRQPSGSTATYAVSQTMLRD